MSEISIAIKDKTIKSIISQIIRLEKLFIFLSVKEIIKLSKVCKEFHMQFEKEKIIKAVRLGNLDTELRSYFWLKECPVYSLMQDYRKILQLKSIYESPYDHLIVQSGTCEKIFVAFKDIKKDVGRTFDSEEENSKEFLGKLEKILKAIAYINQNIGYCQGMNYIAGIILYVFKDEEYAFWVFLKLIIKEQMAQVFVPGVPGLKLKNYILNDLIKLYIPKIHDYFQKIGIISEFFTSKWIITLFAAFFQVDETLKIYDQFFLDGWISIYKISLALLLNMEKDIYAFDQVSFSIYLRDFKKNHSININELLRKSQEFQIQKSQIEEIEDKYYMEIAESLLQSQQRNPVTENRDHLDKASNILEKLEKDFKNDMQYLQKKKISIEDEFSREKKKYDSIKQVYSSKKQDFENLQDFLSANQCSIEIIKRIYDDLKHNRTPQKPKKNFNGRNNSPQFNLKFEEISTNFYGQYGSKRDAESLKKLKEDIEVLEDRIKDTIEKVQIMSIDLREIKNFVIINKNLIMEISEKKELIVTQYEKLASIFSLNKKKILKELIENLKKTKKYIDTYSF